MNAVRGPSGGRRLAAGLAIALALLAIADLTWTQALAQNPFGAGKGAASAAEAQSGGIVAWLLAKQAEFYRAMSATIRAAKSDGSAVVTLLGIAFLYGIFHAAGPGHGKAVISSYLVANEETARRGIVLSFASALMQALVAIAIVGVAAWLLNVTAKTMCSTERAVEIASYGLIAALGARLMWLKGRPLFRPAQLVPALAAVGAHSGDHGHHHHDHPHVHDDGCGCGHSHGPEPAALAGPQGWRHGLTAVATVGIRPCSGAILVLVFALAQGLFWAGIAATFAMALGTAITVTGFALLAVSAKGLARRLAGGRGGRAAPLLRGIEFGAATLVMLFGLALLSGVMAAERTTCF
jgi:ABC-type nickel/cobalt efflux system permease component RcnA